MSHESSIPIDVKQLTPAVEALIGEPLVNLGEWQSELLHGGLEVANQLYRVWGESRTASGNRSWSLVLKTVTCTAEAEWNPTGMRYWMREAEAYRSGLLGELPCGVAAPRCYLAKQVGWQFWLWLEELKDDLPKPWSLEQLSRVAFNLGCSNGAYLAGQPLPDYPWLTRNWLRKYVEIAAPQIRDLEELRQLPLFQRNFPHISNAFFLEAWQRRDEFLNAIERLPQTFAHLDAWVNNLFWRNTADGQGQVVALDWAYSGIAAVGEELAPLVNMSAFIDPQNYNTIFDNCLESYLQGLAQAGWQGDPQLVRFGAAATIFYRYLFGGILGEGWSGLRDERNHAGIAAAFGVPDVYFLVDMIAAVTPLFYHTYQTADELLPLIR